MRGEATLLAPFWRSISERPRDLLRLGMLADFLDERNHEWAEPIRWAYTMRKVPKYRHDYHGNRWWWSVIDPAVRRKRHTAGPAKLITDTLRVTSSNYRYFRYAGTWLPSIYKLHRGFKSPATAYGWLCRLWPSISHLQPRYEPADALSA